MPNTIIASPVNAPTTLPDAAAREAREQRRRKLEQDIDDLFGIETPVTANYHAPLRSTDAGKAGKP